VTLDSGREKRHHKERNNENKDMGNANWSELALGKEARTQNSKRRGGRKTKCEQGLEGVLRAKRVKMADLRARITISRGI